MMQIEEGKLNAHTPPSRTYDPSSSESHSTEPSPSSRNITDAKRDSFSIKTHPDASSKAAAAVTEGVSESVIANDSIHNNTRSATEASVEAPPSVDDTDETPSPSFLDQDREAPYSADSPPSEFLFEASSTPLSRQNSTGSRVAHRPLLCHFTSTSSIPTTHSTNINITSAIASGMTTPIGNNPSGHGLGAASMQGHQQLDGAPLNPSTAADLLKQAMLHRYVEWGIAGSFLFRDYLIALISGSCAFGRERGFIELLLSFLFYPSLPALLCFRCALP
jgi:hypothetical protein